MKKNKKNKLTFFLILMDIFLATMLGLFLSLVVPRNYFQEGVFLILHYVVILLPAIIMIMMKYISFRRGK